MTTLCTPPDAVDALLDLYTESRSEHGCCSRCRFVKQTVSNALRDIRGVKYVRYIELPTCGIGIAVDGAICNTTKEKDRIRAEASRVVDARILFFRFDPPILTRAQQMDAIMAPSVSLLDQETRGAIMSRR